LCALAFAAAPTFASAENATTLFPGALDMPVLEGANVPEDCHYPTSLQNAQRYELACVVIPASDTSEDVTMNYIGWLGQHQFRQDMEIVGGISAVRPAAEGCEQVLDIFMREYPPNVEESEDTVIWFALQRQPRCSAQSG
jgi:hypothetical protein